MFVWDSTSKKKPQVHIPDEPKEAHLKSIIAALHPQGDVTGPMMVDAARVFVDRQTSFFQRNLKKHLDTIWPGALERVQHIPLRGGINILSLHLGTGVGNDYQSWFAVRLHRAWQVTWVRGSTRSPYLLDNPFILT
jgi:hypothetical protein